MAKSFIVDIAASIVGAVMLIVCSACVTAAMIGAGLVIGHVADMIRAATL